MIRVGWFMRSIILAVLVLLFFGCAIPERQALVQGTQVDNEGVWVLRYTPNAWALVVFTP
ncbi:MAG: hypothetical protein LDLANPLL_02394 [Turneriella sp.]|nr:hypothetical protein [Turneriella sp.]